MMGQQSLGMVTAAVEFSIKSDYLSMDVMAMTSQHLEKGFEKLARWCATEINYLAREVQLEVSSTMQTAVQWLKKRPELLTCVNRSIMVLLPYIMLRDAFSALSQIRQITILNAFLTALTRGGPNGLPRPIEIHAHDPLRYVGDIMAWVHQAVASERESSKGYSTERMTDEWLEVSGYSKAMKRKSGYSNL